MAELYYAFIKDNRVVNVAVFAEKNDELAQTIVEEQNHDAFVWCNDKAPCKYATYDGKTFTNPTPEDLINLGILAPLATEE